MKHDSIRIPLEILVVEDSATQAAQLQYILEEHNFHVVVAKNGKVALELLQVRRPILVISDINMPEMDGYQLCNHIRADPALKDVPVILLTALADPEDVFKGLKCGADNFITKPYEAEHLLARIQYLLANVHLRRTELMQTSMEVLFAGQRHVITSNRAQILNLLLSTYEAAVEKNRELALARDHLADQERELREKNEQLDAALQEAKNAVQAKATFLATMSHEIRTPMNGVIGMTDILRSTELTDMQRDCVDTIHSSGESLLTVINDVLDYSKIESGHMLVDRTPFHLRQCLEEVIDLFIPKIRAKDLEVACSIRNNVPLDVMGDVTRLRQILINLLGNAIKFTAQGDVILTVESRSETAGTHELLFAVRDTGIGISAEALPRLFQSFQQEDISTTRRYGGTGLGLAISKRLSELMGGAMWVESEAGKGSTFFFTLLVEAAPATDGVGRRGNLSLLQGRRVLIVEDHIRIRHILEEQLTGQGLVAASVGSGQAALNALKQETFDVALIDDTLPGLDGLSLARTLREKSPVPLILLASNGYQQNDEIKELFVAQVPKPVKQSFLFESLHHALGIESKRVPSTEHKRFDHEMALAHPLRILMAEDNVTNQKVGLMMLARFGYKAEVVSNGRQAVEAVEKEDYDLVLMDVQMPEMDGTEAIVEIRKQPKSPVPFVVALTAEALEGDRERFLSLGFDSYMSKPIRVEQLQELLKGVAARTVLL